MVIGSLGATGGATLQERIRNAKVLREFQITGAQIKSFKVGGNVVAFVLKSPDSSFVTVYDLKGRLLCRLAGTEGPVVSVEASEDGSTLVVAETLGPEAWITRVFDISGKQRFSLGPFAQVLSSPSGRYFCSTYDGMSENPLSIWGPDGQVTAKVKTPPLARVSVSVHR